VLARRPDRGCDVIGHAHPFQMIDYMLLDAGFAADVKPKLD
jgi:hypothetical protein